MYCPKCATENLDAAHYCRACGTDISLVPQALTGQLPVAETAREVEELDHRGRRRRGRDKIPPTMEKSITNIFIGLGFICASLALSRTLFGAMWWFWLLIPAFTTMGGGVAGLVRARREERRHAALPKQRPAAAAVTSSLPPARPSALPPRDTSEILQPPSVTEGTTRHLGTEAPTQHIGSEPGRKSFND